MPEFQKIRLLYFCQYILLNSLWFWKKIQTMKFEHYFLILVMSKLESISLKFSQSDPGMHRPLQFTKKQDPVLQYHRPSMQYTPLGSKAR